MNKKEFINALGKGLAGLSCEEQDKWLDFYGEMIEDRIEEGLSEEEAVAAVGNVDAVVEQILLQSKPEKKQKKKRELKTWQTVLLIVGSPLWFSLVVAAASVVFSLMVAMWAVVISFYAVAVSLMACGLAGVVITPVMMVRGNMGAGLFCLGAGLFCGGFGMLWFIGTNYMAKGAAWLCKKLFTLCIPGKEAA